MPKINLNEVRGFSDSITVTFNFIKQEFVPFFRSFAALVMPLIFIGLFAKSYFVQETFLQAFDPAAGLEQDTVLYNLFNMLSTFVLFFWIQLEVLAYLRIYQNRYNTGDEARITVAEVWQVMWQKAGKLLGWGFLYVLLLGIGFLSLMIPGIYLSIGLFFAGYGIMLRDRSVKEAAMDSLSLVKGRWWNVFGYLFVLQILVGMLAYVFNIPYMMLTVMSLLQESIPDIYEITFGLLLSELGQFMMQGILIIGAAVRFFSLLEEKDHVSLRVRIESMGQHEQLAESEGER